MPMDNSEIKLLIQEELHAHCQLFVERDYCIERHKEVTAVSDGVKKLDQRLWQLIILGAGQLATFLIALLVWLLKR